MPSAARPDGASRRPAPGLPPPRRLREAVQPGEEPDGDAQVRAYICVPRPLRRQAHHGGEMRVRCFPYGMLLPAHGVWPFGMLLLTTQSCQICRRRGRCSCPAGVHPHGDGGDVPFSSWIGIVSPCLKLRHEILQFSADCVFLRAEYMIQYRGFECRKRLESI